MYLLSKTATGMGNGAASSVSTWVWFVGAFALAFFLPWTKWEKKL
jgi:hypothetical protein